MLRPIKYLVIPLAVMLAVASFSVFKTKSNTKVNLTSSISTEQVSPGVPVGQTTTETPPASPPVPASSQVIASVPVTTTPAPAAQTNNSPKPATRVERTAPVDTTQSVPATHVQTGTQKNTQTNTTTSQSGQTINTSSATNFNSSSMAKVNSAAESDTACLSGSFENQFLCLINNYRAGIGLHTLTEDSALNGVAQNYAAEMHSTENFSHTSTSGATFLDRCKAAGTTCWAENLAMGFTSAQTLFQMWKASPGHNANMVNPGYRSMGLGVSGNYSALYLR